MYRFLVETKDKAPFMNDYLKYEAFATNDEVELYRNGKDKAIKKLFLKMRMSIQDYFYDHLRGNLSNDNNEVTNMMYDLEFIEQYEIVEDGKFTLKFKCDNKC